jgi:hypothetical protein
LTFKQEQFYKQRIAELEKQVAELLTANAELTEKVANLKSIINTFHAFLLNPS